MYKETFKVHHSIESTLPYLSKNEWLLIEDKVADFKDRVLKAYFEEIDNFEDLNSELFHPTNDGHQIVRLIPGFSETTYPDRIRVMSSSFGAFQVALDAFNEYVEANPIDYYVYGGIFLQKLDVNSLIYFLNSTRFKFKSLDLEKEIETLLTVFDYLSDEKIQSMYKKLYPYDKERFDKRMIIRTRLEQGENMADIMGLKAKKE
jgi:hypothetical protein